MLSYLTACFWEDRLYPYPDPEHLVVFNFEQCERSVRYDLGELLKTDAVYTAEELWRGDKISLDGGVLTYRIPNEDAGLFRITLCV